MNRLVWGSWGDGDYDGIQYRPVRRVQPLARGGGRHS
jgi:hypothetical protein